MLPAARVKKLTGVSGTKLAPVRSRSVSNGWASDITQPRPISTSTSPKTNANKTTTSTEFLLHKRLVELELGRRLGSGPPLASRLFCCQLAFAGDPRSGGADDQRHDDLDRPPRLSHPILISRRRALTPWSCRWG